VTRSSAPPVVLSVAGSDPSGGAGIQADLRTFAALGVHGASALTAVTVQGAEGIRQVNPVPAATVAAQIEVVLCDLPVVATKTGLLPTVEVVEAIAELASRLAPLVVDPVLNASAGGALAEPGVATAMRKLLVAVSSVMTPNLAEACALTGLEVGDLASMRRAAASLVGSGCALAVVTGGHLGGGEAIDVAYDGATWAELRSPMVLTRNTRGTGCTFAAAVTAYLAQGLEPLVAVEKAKAFVTAALRGAAGWHLGAGAGPLDQLGWGSLPTS
jgi:hydroxymethylpyrimidine/phosphomethylpyrimidine kinase